jgi:hypothetical protein
LRWLTLCCLSQIYDTQGFHLATTLFECLPREMMEPFIKDILMLLVMRMQSSRTAKVCAGGTWWLGGALPLWLLK